MTINKSYKTVIVERQAFYKKAICQLLLWDELKYAEYQYQAGLSYLYWYLPCDEAARKQLERSKLYWNWFKMVWTEHDYAYCTSAGIEKISKRERLRIYNDLHCPRSLAVECKPNNAVLSDIKKLVA